MYNKEVEPYRSYGGRARSKANRIPGESRL